MQKFLKQSLRYWGDGRMLQAPRVSLQAKVSLQQFWFEQSTSWPANYRPAVTSSCCGPLFELLTVKAVCAEEKQHSNHICEHIIFLHFIDVHGVILRLLCTPPWAVAYVPLAGAGWMPNVMLKSSTDSTCKSKLKPGAGCHCHLCPGTALIGWSWLNMTLKDM